MKFLSYGSHIPLVFFQDKFHQKFEQVAPERVRQIT